MIWQLHLKVLKKNPDGINRIAANEIIESLYSLLSESYPDYLHWAAQEMAEKIRSHIPEWLQSLPSGTDLAVLQELLHDRSEIRSYLPENLLENLVCVASASSLNALEASNTKREHWLNRPSFIEDLNGTKASNYVNIKNSAKNLRSDLPKIHSDLESLDGGKEWIQSHQDFVEFCEILPLVGNMPYPGAIYQSDAGEGPDTVYVCVSQECDCLRASRLLFVIATKTDEIKTGSTSFQFSGKTYRVDPKAGNLLQFDIDEHRAISSLSKVGQIRSQIASRIISRFWSGTTRPAVNHPAFARGLRLDES